MQITSKFIESNEATPDFHGQGRIQGRFSASEFDLRMWWSLEGGKKNLWSLQGETRMNNIFQQRYKMKIWELDFGVTWHSPIYFWPLPMEGFIVPKEVFCFSLHWAKAIFMLGWWRMESNGVNLQKDCGQDQLVLLFAEMRELSANPQVASLWPLPGGEGNSWWNGNPNKQFLQCLPQHWPDAYQGNGRNVGGKTWKQGIVTITSELPHFLQHLSSLDQRGKLRLAQPVSPLVTHSLCAVRTQAGMGQEGYGEVQKRGISKAYKLIGYPALGLMHKF